MAHQTRQQVLVLGEVNLELAFVSARMASEDIQDQGGAVYDLDLKGFFQVSLLGGSEFVVEDHDVGFAFVDEIDELFEFPFAQIRGGQTARFLGNLADHVGARGPGEVGQLGKRVFQAPQIGLFFCSTATRIAASGGWAVETDFLAMGLPSLCWDGPCFESLASFFHLFVGGGEREPDVALSVGAVAGTGCDNGCLSLPTARAASSADV